MDNNSGGFSMVYRKTLAVALPIVSVYTTHYISANVYSRLCTPLSLYGFIKAVIYTASPLCKVVLDVVTTTSDAYSYFIAGTIGYVLGN